MRAVFGLVALDAGVVRWDGAPVSAAERARFGYMPEERGLYPRMRVRDQLVYLGQLCGRPAKDAGLSVDGWLERLGLAARAADRLDALSHGNQQRVQLIAALVGDPDLLVLDEPFAGLDPIAMDAMGGLLSEVAADGVTVLFSSHQLDLVQDLCGDHRPRADRAGRGAGRAAGHGAATVRGHPVPGPGTGLVSAGPGRARRGRGWPGPAAGSAAAPT
jgi:ABC-2 type transport system ATP-binding protein